MDAGLRRSTCRARRLRPTAAARSSAASGAGHDARSLPELRSEEGRGIRSFDGDLDRKRGSTPRRASDLKSSTQRFDAIGQPCQSCPLAGIGTPNSVVTERLARAAVEAGAGFEARFMAAETAHLQGRSDQAEQELATLAAQAASDAGKARVALLRFDNAFLKGGVDSSIIDNTLALITDPFWRDELANRRIFATAISSGPRETMEVATTWIQRPDSALRVVVVHALIQIGGLDEVIKELSPPPDTRAVPAPAEPWH
jgi:hypothetical protein